MLVSTTFVKR